MISYEVRVRETDLLIRSRKPLRDLAERTVYDLRLQLEEYIRQRPEFLESLYPIEEDLFAPPVALDMMRASALAGVGPMAAVAGAIAQQVGRALLSEDPDVIVENGGDIFITGTEPVTIGVFAGESPLNLRLGLKIMPEKMPLGVCTSSGTVGHSLSLGAADAAVVVSAQTALADAAATALGNRIAGIGDLAEGVRWACGITGVSGALVVLASKLAAAGDLELVYLEPSSNPSGFVGV